MRTCKRISLAALLLFMNVPDTRAVTFVTHFIGGAAPANTSGGGNLDDIMNAAVRLWESAYSDPFTVTLYYGWAEVGSAGTHTLLEQGDNPNREISGRILFDNSGAAAFYLDPTPDVNEEYLRLTEEYQDLGGGYVNVARLFVNPAGDAAGHIDLLSVALHEIGHALGLSGANISFREQSSAGVIYISEDLPFAGTVVPLASNNAGVVAHLDATEIAYGGVMAGINGDERRIPSALDILANAQISGFTILDLYPQQPSQSDQIEADDGSSSRGRLASPRSPGSSRPANLTRSQEDRSYRVRNGAR